MKTLSRLVAISAILGLAGCNILPEPQKDSVRYFTLAAPTVELTGDQAVSDNERAENGITTVHPVQIAGHLRNRSMAVRVAENEVIYLEEIRWAQPLADAITSVLRARLDSVAGGKVVSVQIQSCELLRFKGNIVELSATWEIISPGGTAPPQRGSFTTTTRTWDGKDYRELVSELRGAVGDLGDAIAAAMTAKK